MAYDYRGCTNDMARYRTAKSLAELRKLLLLRCDSSGTKTIRVSTVQSAEELPVQDIVDLVHKQVESDQKNHTIPPDM